MPVDWTQFSAGAPPGGVDWGQHSGVAPIIKAPKVQAAPSSGHHGSWFSNAVSDIEDTIHGTANAIVGVGKATGETALSLVPGGHWGDPKALDTFFRGVGEATARQYAHQYGPLFHGDYHTFLQRWHEHPLGPVLDVASLFSLGGGAALKAGRLGVLGERAAEIARTERVLKYRDLSTELPQANTLQGRILQRTLDRYASGPLEDLPYFGAARKVGRVRERAATRRQFAEIQRAKNEMRGAIKRATPEERFAAPIAAEGVPLDELIAHYQKLQEAAPTRTRARYIKVLQNPKVAEALANPSPALVNLVTVGHKLEHMAGTAAMDAGILDPAVRAARAVLPQRLVAGARYEGERTVRVPGEDTHAAVRSSMEHDLRVAERAHTDALRRVQSLTERVRAHTDRINYAGKQATPGQRANLTRARAELARARKLEKEARDNRDLQREAMSQVPAAESPHSVTIAGGFNGPGPERFIGQPNRIHPDLPAPFRFPHIGTRGPAGIYSVPLAKVSKVLAPGFTKRNEGIRFSTARMIRNPDAWLEDFLTGHRYHYSLDWQRQVLDKVRRPLNPDRPGGLDDGMEYYRPSYERKTTGPRVKRDLTDEAVAREDLGLTTDTSVRNRLRRHSEDVATSELPPELSTLSKEHAGIEKLNKQGVYQIPKSYGSAYRREFHGTSLFERYVFDKPTDVWRAFTLKFRPAWTVNNVVGQHILYAMHHAGPAGAIAYLQALKRQPGGDAKLRQIANLRIPLPAGWERSVGKAIDEIAPELHSTGFAHSQVRVTHGGLYKPTLDATRAARAARQLGMVAKAPYVAVKSVGDANAWVNAHLADNIPRDAAFLANARPHIRAIQKAAKETEQVNLTLQDALRRLDKPTVERLVDQTLRQLGDFSSLSHVERTWIRRVIPFYSWFKVITVLTAKYARDYPARINMVRAIENFTNEKDAELPSWLEGAIPLGPAVHGVQPMLSTAGINPFETVNQLAAVAGGLFSGKAQFGTGNPGGLLNPFIQDFLLTGAGGIDPFTGSQYQGFGANAGALRRGAGAFVTDLPQARLYETTRGGGYKSSLYQNTPEDYFLNYFGWPIRRVKLNKARALHREGR